jgi:hypothetical protein
LLLRSANPSYEARTRIPPAPPVAHLSRPAAASIASTSAGPVRRDPRHMRCRRPLRLCLLLLPTLRRLLRRRFLRFSLLRHCCPPSLSVDGDIGAVQSRIRPALQSDYYSGKKITVTPLNFVCNRPRPQHYPPPPAFAGIGGRAIVLQLWKFPGSLYEMREMPMEWQLLT